MIRLTRKSLVHLMLILMCAVTGISVTVAPAAAIDIKKFVKKTPKFSAANDPIITDPNQPLSYLTVNLPVNISDIPLGWRSAKLLTQAIVFFALESPSGEMEAIGLGKSDLKETPLTNSAHFSKNVPVQITQLKQGGATNNAYAVTFASLRRNDQCLFLGVGTAGNFDAEQIGATSLSGFDQYKGVEFDCSNNNVFPIPM